MGAVVVELFKDTGVWRLNQPDLGISGEPLVSGMERILDGFVARTNLGRSRFKVALSAGVLQELDGALLRECEDAGGFWYVSEIDEEKGWLGLSGLKLLFDTAPKRIYYRVQPDDGENPEMSS